MEGIEELTECCICTEIFTDPKILPCIHTFCLKCLEGIASTLKQTAGDTLPCPICRKQFTIPDEGMTGLQKNFLMERLAEMIRISKPPKGPIMCEICINEEGNGATDGHPAKYYCVRCQKNICDRCFKDHKRYKDLRDHPIAEFGSPITEELKRIFSTQYCERHSSKKYEIYCNDCNEVLCVSCLDESHRSHGWMDIQKVAKEFREKIRGHIDQMEVCLAASCSRTVEFVTEKEGFLEQLTRTEAAVISRGMEIKSLMDKRVQSLVDQLALIKQKTLKEIEMGIEENETNMANIESLKAFCTAINENGSDADLCYATDDLSIRTSKLLFEAKNLKEVPKTGVSFEVSNSEDLLEMTNIFGQIKVSNSNTEDPFREVPKASVSNDVSNSEDQLEMTDIFAEETPTERYEENIESTKAEKPMKKHIKKKESRKSGSTRRKKIKCVVVGDYASGKTGIITTYISKSFQSELLAVPTAFENYAATVTVDNAQIDLQLWDTGGSDGYDRLRPLSYPDTDVVIMCFSIESPDSLENITEKWYPEVREFCPRVPILLVGTKLDLREDKRTIEWLHKVKQSPVTHRQGLAVSEEIKAANYLECSAKTQEGVSEVFEEAVRIGLSEELNPRKGEKCKLQ